MSRVRPIKQPSARRGSVLLVVLVIIMLLALGAYTFTELSLAENEATTMFGRSVMARAFADSGIDVAANALADPTERLKPDPYTNRPDLFSAVLLRDAEVPRGRGRFSVVAPASHDTSGQSLQYGLTDESGKLNLNAIPGFGLTATQNRNFFLYIPNMTPDVVDAILDWIDSDDQPGQYGAESDYYMGMSPPYRPANGPLTSLDDLLMVRGVTPFLLWGEDLNRNGFLDPGEDLNGDGYLDRGWSAYFTIYSSERNLQEDGTPRININQQSLVTLYNQLVGALGATGAQFIVAYRMNGPSSSGSAGSGGGSSGGSGSGGSSGSTSSGSSSSGSGGSSGNSSNNGSSSNTTPLGGMNVPTSGSSSNSLTSVYQLLGASVTASINGRNTTLTSPWPATVESYGTNLPMLLEKLTLTNAAFIPGRININKAPYDVLMGLPNMTQQVATQIVGAQGMGSSNSTSGGSLSPRATAAWLLAEQIVAKPTGSGLSMQNLDPYITAHGDVYRVQSVGYFDEGGPVVRVEAVIDASVQPPKIVNIRDLSRLGRGFIPHQLGVP